MTTTAITPSHAAADRAASPFMARLVLGSVIAAAITAGFLATGPEAARQATALAGNDLTRLLRAMAMIKAAMALAAIAALFWRIGAPIALPRFAAYALAATGMAAGPALIWDMAHVGLGALLLHAGLFATLILLWRDPAVSVRLATLVAARRRATLVAARRRVMTSA